MPGTQPTEQSYQDFCDAIAPTVITRFGRFMHRDDTEFVNKVTQFFTHPPVKPFVNTPPLSSAAQLVDNNFIVGEAHSDTSPKKFLMDNMAALKANGFTTLYLEHLFYDHQKDLDNYFATGVFSARLDQQLKTLDVLKGRFHHQDYEHWQTYNFTALLKCARAAGIRVVGIDVSHVYENQNMGVNDEQLDDIYTVRIPRMNYMAYHIIQREQAAAKGKWCALIGNMHVQTQKNTPGVADLFTVRRVYVADKAHDKTLPVTSLDDKESTSMMLNTTYQATKDLSFQADLFIRHDSHDTTKLLLTQPMQAASPQKQIPQKHPQQKQLAQKEQVVTPLAKALSEKFKGHRTVLKEAITSLSPPKAPAKK